MFNFESFKAFSARFTTGHKLLTGSPAGIVLHIQQNH
jgi:hypothetical protein